MVRPTFLSRGAMRVLVYLVLLNLIACSECLQRPSLTLLSSNAAASKRFQKRSRSRSLALSMAKVDLTSPMSLANNTLSSPASRGPGKAGHQSPSEGNKKFNPYHHEILTLEQERSLGHAIQRAQVLKEKMAVFIKEADKCSTQASSRKYNQNLGMDRPHDIISKTVTSLAGNEWNNCTDHIFQSDRNVMETLGLPGGRAELAQILMRGAKAREKLMRSNFRLVLSIARKWCRRSVSRSADANIYAGSWTRPSLDEVVQEGIIGLAIAADRYDYTRKLRFSTYATYWITNSVRQCFQRAATGCIRVPQGYHLVRQRYEKLIGTTYQRTGGQRLPIEAAASELGLAPERLDFILKRTEPLISIDAPLQSSTTAGKAGAQDSTTPLDVFHTLSCPETGPEDKVEISLLRQCLETAMATELSPHERDVLRLRHGLDDGVSRSFREVVDIMGTLSITDVRKSENTAFRKLRSPYSVHSYNLHAFLDYIGVDSSSVNSSMP